MATNRLQYLKKMNLEDKSYGLSELSKISGVSKSILQQVYNRGIGAYGNLGSVRLLDFSKNPDTSKFPAEDRLSKEQWAMARVYSFLNKGTTYKTTDSDLAEKANY